MSNRVKMQRTKAGSTVTGRIVQVVLCSIIPVALVAGYFVATGVKKDIDTARLEQKGDAYQRPLELVMRGIAVHQRATAALDAKAPNDVAEQEGSRLVAAGLAQLHGGLSGIASDLQVTKEGLGSRKRDSFAPEHLEAEWQEIESKWHSLRVCQR